MAVGSRPGPPWQFLFRAAVVITGLTMLLIVDVHSARQSAGVSGLSVSVLPTSFGDLKLLDGPSYGFT